MISAGLVMQGLFVRFLRLPRHKTVFFVLFGSIPAVQRSIVSPGRFPTTLGWRERLRSRHRPCNFKPAENQQVRTGAHMLLMLPRAGAIPRRRGFALLVAYAVFVFVTVALPI